MICSILPRRQDLSRSVVVIIPSFQRGGSPVLKLTGLFTIPLVFVFPVCRRRPLLRRLVRKAHVDQNVRHGSGRSPAEVKIMSPQSNRADVLILTSTSKGLQPL